jgi:hypothetical protein
MKKGTWVVVMLAGVSLAAPQIALAATGSYSTSTSTPAVTATSTYSSGRALYGKASGSTARAIHGWASNTSQSAINTGIAGQTSAGGSNFDEGTFGNFATGVKGVATANSTEVPLYTNGVWGNASSLVGTGVFGTSPGWGLYGIGGIYGVYSQGDLGSSGHLYQDWGSTVGDDLRTDIAGECTMTAGTKVATCNFPSDFVLGTTPIVVVTPTTDPGSVYWGTATLSAVTVNTASNVASNTTFNYVVVGIAEAPDLGGGVTSAGVNSKPRRLG